MDEQVWYRTLNPVDFLERSALVYPNKASILYDGRTTTYAEFHGRVNRLAGALKRAGIQKGDRVAVVAPNVPCMLEGHFGPLRIGAVLGGPQHPSLAQGNSLHTQSVRI